MKTFRDSVTNGDKLTGTARKLFVALYDLIDELDQYEVPQKDEDDEFGEDTTAYGYAMKVLREI